MCYLDEEYNALSIKCLASGDTECSFSFPDALDKSNVIQMYVNFLFGFTEVCVNSLSSSVSIQSLLFSSNTVISPVLKLFCVIWFYFLTVFCNVFGILRHLCIILEDIIHTNNKLESIDIF
jgi:hypothetical protein